MTLAIQQDTTLHMWLLRRAPRIFEAQGWESTVLTAAISVYSEYSDAPSAM